MVTMTTEPKPIKPSRLPTVARSWKDRGYAVLAVSSADLAELANWLEAMENRPACANRLLDTLAGAAQAEFNKQLSPV